ncbi:HlyD family efflux transporter periplasmic adaptor subunit [Aurantiacibacter xanthus]|uniref:HlyD family efflux transporter periplasmic adaptor subunit n=1 Tax=Aurantiacibacter xanthus TaxID=1784712 RepID=A0A3A1P2B4_9SPHN|nr:efflux RND transporter periplasmic adaptor subunit [Aurantiacibacter xanthus]RIV81596.1 HlyD family efflux transporter periplasmic adaptor subunit [Aurantiacibacter xanthus]
MANEADLATDHPPRGGARSPSHRLALTGLALAVGLAAAGLWYASRPAPAPLQGVVEAEEASVATKAFARVVSLAADEGDEVRQGQILGELSSPALDLLVNQSEAGLTTADALNALADNGARPEDIASLREVSVAADAAAGLATVTAQRMERLYAQGVISAQRRDEATAGRTAAVANAAAARAQYQRALAGRREETRTITAAQDKAAAERLEAAREAEAEKQLIAPMSGTVERRLAAPGEVVGPGVPIFRIIDTAHPYVTLRVGESRLQGLRKGARLAGRVPALGERELEFVVTSISASADYTSEQATRQGGDYDARSFALKLAPVQNDGGLLPGMSVLFDWPQ